MPHSIPTTRLSAPIAGEEPVKEGYRPPANGRCVGLGRHLLRTLAIAAAICAASIFALRAPACADAPAHFETERDALPSSNHAFRPSPAIETEPTTGPGGFDLERLWSGYDDWEPVTAADPGSSYVYQITTRLGGPKACPSCAANSVVFRRSRNGGATWEPDHFLIASSVNQYDPQISVARDGAVYVAFLLSFKPGVTFQRSTDHGTTWSTPLSFSGPGSPVPWSDRPALAISASGRDVYLAFNHSDSYVVASHDYGRTFAAPIKTSNDHRYYFHSAGTVAPDGGAYFVAEDWSQNYHGPAHVDVIRSHDSGASWATVRIGTSQAAPRCDGVPGCYFGFLGTMAGLASDAAGTLLVAYNVNDTRNGPQQAYVRFSKDGATWSERALISDPNPAQNNGFPAVAAGPHAGDFRVAWMGTRLGLWDTWYRRLAAGRWTDAVRLSNRRGGSSYTHPGGYDFPYGDYFSIAVDAGEMLHAIWGAGPNYNGPGGTWYTRGP